MTKVLQCLVGRGISVRNMWVILKTMVEWRQKEKDVMQFAEYIRNNLKRYICCKYFSGNNILPTYLLDQTVEEQTHGGIRQTSVGSYLALGSAITQALLECVWQTVGDFAQMQDRLVLIVFMDIRRYVRKLMESDYVGLPVLSYQELI